MVNSIQCLPDYIRRDSGNAHCSPQCDPSPPAQYVGRNPPITPIFRGGEEDRRRYGKPPRKTPRARTETEGRDEAYLNGRREGAHKRRKTIPPDALYGTVVQIDADPKYLAIFSGGIRGRQTASVEPLRLVREEENFGFFERLHDAVQIAWSDVCMYKVEHCTTDEGLFCIDLGILPP